MKARCPRHQSVRTHNLNAGTPDTPNECGGCIVEEVHVLYMQRLDLLETIAYLMETRAMIRRRLSEVETRLMFFESVGPTQIQES